MYMYVLTVRLSTDNTNEVPQTTQNHGFMDQIRKNRAVYAATS